MSFMMQRLIVPRHPQVVVSFRATAPTLHAAPRSMQLTHATHQATHVALGRLFSSYNPASVRSLAFLEGDVPRAAQRYTGLSFHLGELGALTFIRREAWFAEQELRAEQSAWTLYARQSVLEMAALFELAEDDVAQPFTQTPVFNTRELRRAEQGKAQRPASGWRVREDLPKVVKRPKSVQWNTVVNRLSSFDDVDRNAARAHIYRLFPQAQEDWHGTTPWMLEARLGEVNYWGLAVAERGPYFLIGGAHAPELKLTKRIAPVANGSHWELRTRNATFGRR